MAGAQQLWSLTPGDNQTADPSINYREGQAPSTLNDATRQVMSRLKAYIRDTAGVLVTGGISTAYTLTTNEGFTSLIDGLTVAARLNVANGASPTLNVDGLGAVPITLAPTVAPPAGSLVASVPYKLTYVLSDNEWRLASFGDGILNAPAGTRMLFQQTAAPAGWTKEVSAAYDDSALRIVTGSVGNGGATGFTSVFAARTIAQANLPNVNFNGTAASDGAHTHTTDSQGSHTHTGDADNNGDHVHGPGAGSQFVVEGGTGTAAGGGSDREFSSTTAGAGAHTHSLSINSAGAHTHTALSAGAHTHSVSVASGGLGTALDFAVKYRDIIIAQKA